MRKDLLMKLDVNMAERISDKNARAKGRIYNSRHSNITYHVQGLESIIENKQKTHSSLETVPIISN